MSPRKHPLLRCTLAAALLLPAAALAQTDPPPVRGQFIDMEALAIDGHAARPQITYIDAQQRAKHERLMKLKKSFLPKLRATAKAAELR